MNSTVAAYKTRVIPLRLRKYGCLDGLHMMDFLAYTNWRTRSWLRYSRVALYTGRCNRTRRRTGKDTPWCYFLQRTGVCWSSILAHRLSMHLLLSFNSSTNCVWLMDMTCCDCTLRMCKVSHGVEGKTGGVGLWSVLRLA